MSMKTRYCNAEVHLIKAMIDKIYDAGGVVLAINDPTTIPGEVAKIREIWFRSEQTEEEVFGELMNEPCESPTEGD